MSNKAIVDKISAIKLNGFEFRLIENNYLSFLKHEEKRVLIIGGGSLEKSKVNNLDSSIHFIEIENFFHREDDDYSRTMSLINHNQVLNESLGKSFLRENLPFEIEQNNVESLTELLNLFHTNVASTFFEKWTDIRKLLPFLELEYDDFFNQNKLIKLNGLIKRMIVWKFCGHPKTEEYIAFHNERFEKILETNQSKKTVRDINKYKEIRDNLMRSEQLYEWDENNIRK